MFPRLVAALACGALAFPAAVLACDDAPECATVIMRAMQAQADLKRAHNPVRLARLKHRLKTLDDQLLVCQ